MLILRLNKLNVQSPFMCETMRRDHETEPAQGRNCFMSATLFFSTKWTGEVHLCHHPCTPLVPTSSRRGSSGSTG